MGASNRKRHEQGGNRGKPAGSKKRRRNRWRVVILWLLSTTAFAVFCAIAGYLIIMLNGERLLNENMDKTVLAEATTFYDIHGKEVRKSGVNRELMDFTDMPEQLVQAFIATEDRRFYEHNGIDFWSIGRAAVKDIIARSMVEGGSTITQQLAKNLFLNADKTFFRKATEASIALALENNKSKDQIMELYLNRIYFGKGAYGIKAAAETYFGKTIGSGKPEDELELWEIATLAGIPKAPNVYNPLSNPDRSQERRAVVLKLMYDQRLISLDEKEKAALVEYAPPAAKKNDRGGFESYIDYVIQEAVEVTGLSEDQLILKGYDIYTTLDSGAQTAMESAFDREDLFQEDGPKQKEQAAMVIVDQHSGGIVAMVGGRDYVQKGLNRAVVPRQPGSSFKPLAVYAPALETGKWHPYSTLRDVKQCFGNYCPSNLGKYRGSVSLSEALKDSINLPAVWLLDQIGVKTGMTFVESLGIPLDKEDRNLSIALGGLTRGASPLQMAQAYSAFANDGKQYQAHSIREIKDTKGVAVYSRADETPKQVMSRETAYYMTDMLQGVVTSGTGKRAKMNRPVAGKTGTTQLGIKGLKDSSGNRDAWFVGYTPEWTAAVWMGFDRTDKEHYVKHGSGNAALLFSEVMSKALSGRPVSPFPTLEKEEPVATPDVPDKVAGLQAVYNEEDQSVFLTWTPVANLGYRVYKKTSDTDFVLFQELAQYIDVRDYQIESGQTYEYYVTAYDPESKQESERSDPYRIAIPEEEPLEPEVPLEPEEPAEPEQPEEPIEPSLPTDPAEPTPETPGKGTDIPTDPGSGGVPEHDDAGDPSQEMPDGSRPASDFEHPEGDN